MFWAFILRDCTTVLPSSMCKPGRVEGRQRVRKTNESSMLECRGDEYLPIPWRLEEMRLRVGRLVSSSVPPARGTISTIPGSISTTTRRSKLHFMSKYTLFQCQNLGNKDAFRSRPLCCHSIVRIDIKHWTLDIISTAALQQPPVCRASRSTRQLLLILQLRAGRLVSSLLTVRKPHLDALDHEEEVARSARQISGIHLMRRQL